MSLSMLLSTRMLHYNSLFFEGTLVSVQKRGYLNEPDHHYRGGKKNTQTNKTPNWNCPALFPWVVPVWFRHLALTHPFYNVAFFLAPDLSVALKERFIPRFSYYVQTLTMAKTQVLPQFYSLIRGFIAPSFFL